MRYFLLFFYLLLMGFSLPVATNAAVVQKSYSTPPLFDNAYKAAIKKIKKKKNTNPYLIMGLILCAFMLGGGIVATVFGFKHHLPIAWIIGLLLVSTAIVCSILFLI